MNVVQVGYGYWGVNISEKIMQTSMMDLIALCEVQPQLREKARRVLPLSVDVNEDYTHYLDRPDIEGFVIATQTDNSFQIAMDALEAGKHVYIEKPIATNVARAERLREKAYEKKRIIHCDHILLYNPYLRYIKNLIDQGELGDLMYVDIERLNLGPIRKDVNTLMDLAVHDVAILDWITGGEKPLCMSAYGHKPFGNQETLTFLSLKYKTFIASIKSSWVSPKKVRQIVISGTKKMVIFDDMSIDMKVKVYDCGIDVIPALDYKDYAFLNRRGDIYIPSIDFEDSLRNSLEHFAECVRDGKESRSGPEQSLRVMHVLEEAQNQLAQFER